MSTVRYKIDVYQADLAQLLTAQLALNEFLDFLLPDQFDEMNINVENLLEESLDWIPEVS